MAGRYADSTYEETVTPMIKIAGFATKRLVEIKKQTLAMTMTRSRRGRKHEFADTSSEMRAIIQLKNVGFYTRSRQDNIQIKVADERIGRRTSQKITLKRIADHKKMRDGSQKRTTILKERIHQDRGADMKRIGRSQKKRGESTEEMRRMARSISTSKLLQEMKWHSKSLRKK